MKCLVSVMFVLNWAAAAPSAFCADGRQLTYLDGQNITLHESQSPGMSSFYSVVFSLPAGLNTDNMTSAVLELVVNVSSSEQEGFEDPAPVLHVVALSRALGAELHESDLRMETACRRPIPAGAARRVKVDITRIIRSYLAGQPNLGLVIGGLLSSPGEEFEMRSDGFANGALARIAYYSLPVATGGKEARNR